MVQNLFAPFNACMSLESRARKKSAINKRHQSDDTFLQAIKERDTVKEVTPMLLLLIRERSTTVALPDHPYMVFRLWRIPTGLRHQAVRLYRASRRIFGQKHRRRTSWYLCLVELIAIN